MDQTLASIIEWAAPIASTVIITALTVQINQRGKRDEEERARRNAETDAKRKDEAEWRKRIEQRLADQDDEIRAVLEAQCTQMRSDITHKIHRYMDDLHAASTEEKQSLWAEYEVYAEICAKHHIKNHFVEQMVQKVMNLPDRTV